MRKDADRNIPLPNKSSTAKMVNQQLVQGLLENVQRDRSLLSGQMFRGSPPTLTPDAQRARDEAVVEAHKHLRISTYRPNTLRASKQKDFHRAETLFAIVDNQDNFPTCFENVRQAKAFAKYLCELDVDRFPPGTQDPLSAEQKRVTVAVFVQACLSLANAADSDRKIEQFGRKACEMRLIEIRCWALLSGCYARITNSKPPLRPLGLSHTSLTLANLSLAQRVNGIIDVLSTSKSRTIEVLQPTPLLQLVDNPGHLQTRTAMN